jgi:hypothetical protein
VYKEFVREALFIICTCMYVCMKRCVYVYKEFVREALFIICTCMYVCMKRCVYVCKEDLERLYEKHCS